MSKALLKRPAVKVRRANLRRPGIKAHKPAQGLVDMCVHGMDFTPSHYIAKIQAGLPFRELVTLQGSLEVSAQELADKLGISKATLQRRKLKGRFDIAESERLVRFARLVGRAAEVMGSVENGRRWLHSPQYGLGGAIPLDYAKTEIGAREVEDLLGRIEYGVYS